MNCSLRAQKLTTACITINTYVQVTSKIDHHKHRYNLNFTSFPEDILAITEVPDMEISILSLILTYNQLESNIHLISFFVI